LTNPFQYTGRDFDSETGLRYYRARYYDPVVGRFISEDPTGFDAGINFYAYVSNRPTGLRDPGGMNAGTMTFPVVSGGITVCFASGVCETVIVATGTVVGAGAVIYMLAQAKPQIKDWKKRQCGDNCGPILDLIYARMEEIKRRYYQMMTDPLNQFNMFYSQPDPFRPWTGTWIGHGTALLSEQRGLIGDIATAKILGCPVPPEAYALAYAPVPLFPGWKGFKP
ncbi:MAG TPA: RHS repeat-associated core domain-containing protein, partial [Candidatus Saccharimonadales bacterium]|nr:RHS repeat-associated core domain-containing protein [Candidatus Saccharimonadales bacterium]